MTTLNDTIQATEAALRRGPPCTPVTCHYYGLSGGRWVECSKREYEALVSAINSRWAGTGASAMSVIDGKTSIITQETR